MRLEIIQAPDQVLRHVSTNVLSSQILTRKFTMLIANMLETLNSCKEGVALAAPQVGVNLRLFVISASVFKEGISSKEPLVYINPRILKYSVKKVELDEGCLSVKNVFGKIIRSEKVTIEAWDETGKRFTRGGSGLLAELFQHEINHLDGILFTDAAKNLRTVADR